MRCVACDKNLGNRESTRKSPVTGQYYDLCDKCFDTIKDQVEVVENPLSTEGEEESESN